MLRFSTGPCCKWLRSPGNPPVMYDHFERGNDHQNQVTHQRDRRSALTRFVGNFRHVCYGNVDRLNFKMTSMITYRPFPRVYDPSTTCGKCNISASLRSSVRTIAVKATTPRVRERRLQTYSDTAKSTFAEAHLCQSNPLAYERVSSLGISRLKALAVAAPGRIKFDQQHLVISQRLLEI